MSSACFVTGTDTEVGKTYATVALLHRARQLGRTALGLKAVAAGTGADGENEDVQALRAANSIALPERTLNPYRFTAPIAPHIAAREAGVDIRFPPILAALAAARQRAGPDGLVLVEGAGGFRIPLGPDGDSADLAVALGLPLILVVGLRLGCLNHALLTVEAIAARGLVLAGWIANCIDPAMSRFDDNLQTLTELIPAPRLGVIPHGLPGGPAAAATGLQLPAG
ncbi:MAG: dethiobiotin synthase [Azovibrio sp.]|uniref:dethiobiotin synthase n=1 Tax=Azovibrio sp. TaxID=1872673 RepID=UPI003C760CD8